MPVGLPTAIEVAESEPDAEFVLLFCLSGLTASLYLLHLFPAAAADAFMLLSCAG
jgi:hypothetical protein